MQHILTYLYVGGAGEFSILNSLSLELFCTSYCHLSENVHSHTLFIAYKNKLA